ncbi:MAG: hypothetical protein ABI599_09375 [Flavobacteriales bacterium]
MRTLFAFLVLLASQALLAQKTIYAYAIGNWRNGPTVQMTEVFETTEQFTPEQITARVKAEYVAFKEIPDTDVQFFTERSTAQENQKVLIGKYAMRKLPVLVTTTDGSVTDRWPRAAPDAPAERHDTVAPTKP